jgi:hypothetical protein
MTKNEKCQSKFGLASSKLSYKKDKSLKEK